MGTKYANTPVAILHGWGSSSTQLLLLACPFVNTGYNVLLFDAHNHGQSSSQGVASLPKFSEALCRVLDWLHKTRASKSEQTVLVGHSVGDGAVLLGASQRHDIHAVISLPAFAHLRQFMAYYLRHHHIPSAVTTIILCYVEWVIGHHFDSIAPIHTAARINPPLLLVHGTADTTG